MTVQTLVDRIRETYGPFFVARLGLRVSFSLQREADSSDRERLQDVIQAASELGCEIEKLGIAELRGSSPS